MRVRLEGDAAEAKALLAVLTAAGVEVQVGTRKARREGFRWLGALRTVDRPVLAARRDLQEVQVAGPRAGRRVRRRARCGTWSMNSLVSSGLDSAA